MTHRYQPERKKTLKLKVLLLSSASGALTALAFPKFNLFFLSWISLIPWLSALPELRLRHAFLSGWAAGTSFYAVLLYWIQAVPAHYGGLSPQFSLLIYLGFALFLGIFWAVFAWVYGIILRAYPKLGYFAAPLLWVAMEYTFTHFLTGFPWGLLGTSQYQNLYFLQTAAVTGVYGISFLLVYFQSQFLYSLRWRKRFPFFLALSIILIVHAAGVLSIVLPADPPESSFIKAGVVQGNVSADTDFNQLDSSETEMIFRRHLKLSQEAVDEGAELIIWPELSIPMCFTCNYNFYLYIRRELSAFAAENQVYFLLGTSEIEQASGGSRYYNASTCLAPDGSLTFYHKNHLVPFGEYTPYKTIFSFIANFTHAIGELTPGGQLVMHNLRGIPFGTPICYEIIFPDEVRSFVRQGAQFLITITNDGWYGKSSAPYQHFAMAVIRAVENRRYVLRAATTGISGIIDPYGRIIKKTKLNETVQETAAAAPRTNLSIYTRFGYRFSHLCLTLSGVFFILALFKRKYGKSGRQ